MPEVLLIKNREGSFAPADETAWDKTRKIPAGARCVAVIKDPSRRSNRQHAFWFAMVSELFKNQETYKDFDEFRARLLVYLGYFEPVKTKEGETIAMPKSLKFGKMDAEEFTALVDATLDFAESIGFDRAELLAQTEMVA